MGEFVCDETSHFWNGLVRRSQLKSEITVSPDSLGKPPARWITVGSDSYGQAIATRNQISVSSESYFQGDRN
ncbi:hypothetical protein [Laspinema olomoucense]|uniref:hypothetical protein n=1 Tax=Laspinema olomoucense TaxID=3231600 RepID=UPI0021BAD026|nr:hypothetical protein [Laspinema sp. D3d]MCT7975245.1 hypothetical protein [Laspinema sp. D3d]